jgi:hypothetical protein
MPKRKAAVPRIRRDDERVKRCLTLSVDVYSRLGVLATRKGISRSALADHLLALALAGVTIQPGARPDARGEAAA